MIEELYERRAKLLFKLTVELVALEISAACNRGCSYCPQSFLQREEELMPLELFEKAMRELRELSYTGGIAFHLFNEPLLVPDHFRAALSLAASYLPECMTRLFTNGDRLTREMITEFGEKGLKDIVVSCHLPPSVPWDPGIALRTVYKFCKRTGIPTSAIHNETRSVDTEVDGVHMLIRCPDMHAYGSSRLNTVPVRSEGRMHTLFCAQMMKVLHIAYSGTGYMCCDCCHGMPEAEPYALGSLHENSVLELFKAKLPMISGYVYGDMPPACRSCFGQ